MILAGLLMVAVSVTRLSRFITLLPSPVMLGFCNGLAIVIGLSQLHPFEDPHTHHWKEGPEMIWMLVICFTAMGVMELFPKIPLQIFKVIPSSLLAIIVSWTQILKLQHPTTILIDLPGRIVKELNVTYVAYNGLFGF